MLPATTSDADTDAALTRLRLQVAAGHVDAVPVGLPQDARAAIAVAHRVGAPMLPVLDAVSDAREHRRRIDRQVATATAPARSVAVLLVVLPVVAVPVLGRLLGTDLVSFYTSGPGVVVGAVAVVLWGLGAITVAGVVRHAGRDPRPSGPTVRVVVAAAVAALVLAPWAAVPAAVVARATFRPPVAAPPAAAAEAADLVATGLSAGLTVAAALRVAADHVPDLRTGLRRLAWQVELGRLGAATPDGLDRLATTLADGLDAGGPLVPALRSLAHEVRADRGAAAEARALRLPARLTFPTSLLLLPATILAIGAPIVATGLSAVGGA